MSQKTCSLIARPPRPGPAARVRGGRAPAAREDPRLQRDVAGDGGQRRAEHEHGELDAARRRRVDPVQHAERAVGQREREHEDGGAADVMAQRRRSRPRTPNVSRRLAAVLATAVIASAAAFAPAAPSGPCRSRNSSAKASVLTTPMPRKRASGAEAASRATPRRSSSAVRTICTRESGSSTQSTGTSWIRRPRRWASTSSSVSKNQPSSRTASSSPRAERVGAGGLEAALRVAEAGAQHRVQDRVVGARDQLALGPAHDAGAMRQPRPDREVAVAGEQRGDEREQAAQVGREVDVHVGDDARLRGRPGGAQRAAAALALEPQQLDAGQRVRRAGRRSPASRPCSRCRRSRSAS